MKIRILSDLPQYDLSDPIVMFKLNEKLGNNISWNYSPESKILNIECCEEISSVLLEEYKDVAEVILEDNT